MLKTVKVTLEVYDRLEAFRGKHETFSQAVERLLVIREGLFTLSNVVSGVKVFGEWQDAQRTKEQEEKKP